MRRKPPQKPYLYLVSSTIEQGKRVTMDLSGPAYRRLKELERGTRQTLASVFRNSFTLYDYLYQHVRAGFTLWMKNPEGKVFPLDLKILFGWGEEPHDPPTG
jgi:hypothetical protein